MHGDTHAHTHTHRGMQNTAFQNFLQMQKAQIKKKTDILDHTEITNFCPAEDITKESKDGRRFVKHM